MIGDHLVSRGKIRAVRPGFFRASLHPTRLKAMKKKHFYTLDPNMQD
jgi:hypothetical protein